jgi:carboxymethylenebutenolidase
MSDTLELASAGGAMGLYVAKPEGKAAGAVIVVQEAFGVTDHIKDVCERFAAKGYVAVAPHIFHRSGDPIIDYARMQDVMPHIMTLTAEGIEADLKATIDAVQAMGFSAGQIGVVGFCMGGTIALVAAKLFKLGAAVTFYGGGITQGRFGFPALVELAPELKTPWLGLYGDADQSIPLTEVEVLRRAAAKASVSTDVKRYPDADHGFHCDHRPSFYNEAAAKDGWGRAVDWLKANLQAG